MLANRVIRIKKVVLEDFEVVRMEEDEIQRRSESEHHHIHAQQHSNSDISDHPVHARSLQTAI